MVLAPGLFLVVFAATLSVPICTNDATECFLMSVDEVAITMNMYRLGFSIALDIFVFPWVAAVGAWWVFEMAAFFNIFAALLISLLAWRGQSYRRFTPKGLLATGDGEKVDVAGGVRRGLEENLVEAVNDSSKKEKKEKEKRIVRRPGLSCNFEVFNSIVPATIQIRCYPKFCVTFFSPFGLI